MAGYGEADMNIKTVRKTQRNQKKLNWQAVREMEIKTLNRGAVGVGPSKARMEIWLPKNGEDRRTS